MKEIMEEYSTTYNSCMDSWPDEFKNDVYKLYAYLRVCDEMVEGHKTLHDFKHWRKVIEQFYEVSDKHQFDGEWLSDFHISMYQDMIKKEHTIVSMLEYCKGSAESVGMMMAKILECPPEAEDYARALGRAYQIINFVRDYDEDIAKGYQYITDDFKFYIKLFRDELNYSMTGLHYIPAKYRQPIMEANKMYEKIADELS